MDVLLADLRFALRSIRRQPGFALVAVLTLALGIGATAAIFSAVDAVLLRPLDYNHPDRIVAITTDWRRTGVHGTVSAPDFHDWHDRSRSFDALAYYVGGETTVSVEGEPDYASATLVMPELFTVFGVAPELGRVFRDRAQEASGVLPAVIGHGLWMRRFGGRPGALGRAIEVEGQLFTIVGVMPARFDFPDRTEVWIPSYAQPETVSRSGHNYWAVGRLREGVTVASAQAEMATIAADLERAYPSTNEGKGVAVVPLRDELVGSMRPTLYVLLGAVALVLLIACANVANLLLARATGRRGELAVRAALGASRGRLVAQLCVETVLLAVASGAVGVVLARWGVSALVALAPAGLPRTDTIAVDGRVLAFALAVSLGSALVFGLLPALHASRVDPNASLRQSGRGLVGSAGEGLRRTLVVTEMALAVALVCGASLLGRSFVALGRVDVGFNADRVLVVRTAAPVPNRDEAQHAARTYARLLPTLAALPGVSSVAAVRGLPGGALHSNGGYWIEGGPGPGAPGVQPPNALVTVVTPDYFRTLQIPLRRGRDFSARDDDGAPLVAIVSEALVRRSFPAGDAIGHRIECGYDKMAFMTIVGVVADVRAYDPSRPPRPELYLPVAQHPRAAASLDIVARTVGDPLASSTAAVRAIHANAPEIPTRVTTMNVRMSDAVATPRFRTVLIGTFAIIALVLALAGVYGVMAYAVARRTGEIGIRMAMGAAAVDIMRLVLGQVLKLALAGSAFGLALALALGGALRAMLFAVQPTDPLVLAVVPIALLATAAAAAAVPALRAARVDPVDALRAE